jgi:hypothetical protein
MKAERKIAMIVNQVKMEDEDSNDVAYWLSRPPAERLAEVVRLRKNYYSLADGSFPEKMKKVVHRRKM